jgi:hypothetical protein
MPMSYRSFGVTISKRFSGDPLVVVMSLIVVARNKFVPAMLTWFLIRKLA